MNQKHPSKTRKTSVYKHFNPRLVSSVRTDDLPTILPREDKELSKMNCNNNSRKRTFIKPNPQKGKSVQKKKSNQKASTDTDLIKVNIKPSTKKNRFQSKTEPCTLIGKVFDKYPNAKCLCPTPCTTVSDTDSRISYNIDNINRQSTCRMSLRDENLQQTEKGLRNDTPSKCILKCLDNCRKDNVISSLYVESLKNEIKNFPSPKCSKNTNDVQSLRDEIAEFRKSKDEKYNLLYKKLESLKSSYCQPSECDKRKLSGQEDDKPVVALRKENSARKSTYEI